MSFDFPKRPFNFLPAERPDEDQKIIQSGKIALHYTANYMDGQIHVDMWAPYLDAAGLDWYVICREKSHYQTMKSRGRAAVLATEAVDLLTAVGLQVRIILYANNGARNREMLELFPKLKHIQMLHGDSDKASSYSRITANFDKIFVAGPMGMARYADHDVTIPNDVFVEVGRPQVAGRKIGARQGWQADPVVGYAPTWIGGRASTAVSSLDRAARILRGAKAALPQAQLRMKAHPASSMDPDWPRLEAEIRSAIKETDGVYLEKNESPFDLYEQADILITDISSTVIDYLYSGRPILLVLPEWMDRIDPKEHPSLMGCHLVKSDLSNLTEQLADAAGPDSMAQARWETRLKAYGAQVDEVDPITRFTSALQHEFATA